ncbi:MAG: hypothetical protein KDA41_09575, partial [Planctomycetales bacterium]|nr:hypothetical protein [Planctomycetales bacterium]
MHYHFVRTRTVCCLLALAAAVWSLGCRPPASPYGPGANATGANSTDADVDNDGIDDLSTATASNATDAAPIDNVAAAGGTGDPLEPIAVGDNASTVAVAEGAGEAAPAYTADPLDWPYHRGPYSNN